MMPKCWLVVAVCFTVLMLCGCASVPAQKDIPNFAQVKPGLWRGGQPTAAGWAHLKALGVQWDIKLNTETEASDEMARALGIQVIYLPITWVQQTIGKPDPANLEAAVAALQRKGVFVHCQHGQDRTGLIIGAYRVKVDQWPKAAAYAEMAAHGFHPWLRGLYWSWQEDVPERGDAVQRFPAGMVSRSQEPSSILAR